MVLAEGIKIFFKYIYSVGDYKGIVAILQQKCYTGGGGCNMIEYKMVKITPKVKSKLRVKGKRRYFSVIDDHDRHYSCFNYRLYDAIEEGKEIEVTLAEDKRSVIVGIVGFHPEYPIRKTKAPINKAEAELFNLMADKGWELTKKGWPDFACFKDDKLILIEVKPKRSHRLKYWQKKIMEELIRHDIKCYRWSPDGGFEPIYEHVKFPVNLP